MGWHSRNEYVPSKGLKLLLLVVFTKRCLAELAAMGAERSLVSL